MRDTKIHNDHVFASSNTCAAACSLRADHRSCNQNVLYLSSLFVMTISSCIPKTILRSWHFVRHAGHAVSGPRNFSSTNSNCEATSINQVPSRMISLARRCLLPVDQRKESPPGCKIHRTDWRLTYVGWYLHLQPTSSVANLQAFLGIWTACRLCCEFTKPIGIGKLD